MPNPRTNTVVDADDLPKAINDAKQGRVEFRTDRTNLVHVPFGQGQLRRRGTAGEPGRAARRDHERASPTGAKGQYIRQSR